MKSGLIKILNFIYDNFKLWIFYTFLFGCALYFVPALDGNIYFSEKGFIKGCISAAFPAAVCGLIRGLILIKKTRLTRILASLFTCLLSFLIISEIWLVFSLGSRWSERLIMLITDTNASETSDFFSYYFLNFKTLLIFLLSAILLRFIYDVILDLSNYFDNIVFVRLHKITISITEFVLILISGLISILYNDTESGYESMNSLGNFTEAVCQHLSHYNDTRELEKNINLADGYFNTEDRPEQIVWIIGESDSKFHSQLYGYQLPTTPNLLNEYNLGNIIKFEDVISYIPYTNIMMETLLSPYVETQPKEDKLNTPPTPAIMRKAGYYVSFYDNQSTLLNRVERWDGVRTNLLNSWKLSKANFDYRNDSLSTYDKEFIEIYINNLAQKNIPKLDIFHLKGQHHAAKNRFPEVQAIFKISDYAHRQDLNDEEKQIVADYDNATRYLDRNLALIIEQIKDRDAIMIYHPDHSDLICDVDKEYWRKPGRYLTRKYAQYFLAVPFYVYTTPKFREKHPELYNKIKNASQKRFSLMYFSHFLMDIGGVNSKFKHPEYSPLSPDWINPPRIVEDMGNYDDFMKKK